MIKRNILDESTINNKRIARNTILLYVRQIFTMMVSLYTSRIILNTLGINDYGIYNVVGGIVLMLSFINNTMASASQRFLAYDLTRSSAKQLKETFSLTMFSYLIIALFALILCESIAVWFLNSKMNIPTERIEAANWVLQFSIFSFIVNILTTPYLSVIIAREKMDVYAYASIGDVLLKLSVVFILVYIPFDKLKLYSTLIFLCTLIMAIFYSTYCIKHFEESKYIFYYNKSRLKEMFSFAWWNTLGSLANVLRSQGINILLNIFFSPAVNAARAIAFQVNTAITNFSTNFYTAVRPQIIKSYAADDLGGMFRLIFSSSRFAFYLLFIISLPILLETEVILNLWLKVSPEYSSLFVRLVVINSLMEVLSLPLVNGLQAAGKIKTYQLLISTIYLLNIPISYFFLKIGWPPETTMYINIIIVLICFIPRLIICKHVIRLPVKSYIKEVLIKIVIVVAISIGGGYLVVSMFNIYALWQFVTSTIILTLFSGLVILIIGFTNEERTKLLFIINKKMNYVVRKGN